MKIAYFHRLTFEETEQRFKDEAEKMGIELTFIKYKDLILESNTPIDQYNNKPNEKDGIRHAELARTPELQRSSISASSSSNSSNNEILNQVQDDTTKNIQPTSQPANKITINGIDLKDFDIWFIRSVGSELEWSKILQLYARDYNIPVVDDYILTEGVLKRYKSTMGYILAKEGVLYPKTTYFNTFKQIKKYLGVENTNIPIDRDTLSAQAGNKPIEGTCSQCACGGNCECNESCSDDTSDVIARNEETRQSQNQTTSQPVNQLTYPFIIKMSSGGRHGMSTFFIQKESDLFEMENTLKERKERAIKEGKTVPQFRGFLLQEYIPNDGDFRVMTVGYKCIGGFKRAPKEEKLVLNKSQGKSQGMKELPQDVIETAEKAGKVLGIEVAGTDLVRSKIDGKVYVVEVNEAPQFKVFEKRTGINAPKLILNYLIQKSKIQ